MLTELCTWTLFLLNKLWINQFCLKVLKILHDNVRKKDQKCGAAVICSFTTTMPLPTALLFSSKFGQKQYGCYPSSTPFTRHCAMRLFLVPLYERPDVSEKICWSQRSEKITLEVLKSSALFSTRNVFSSGKRVGISFSSQPKSTLKETRVVIV